jgi:ATP-binding protein involved in chromosome partitioning
VVVTTPQLAAREVAERAGAIATQTRQRLAGVIENMAGYACPHCGEMVDVFGAGGGQAVADSLTALIGAPVPLLGSVPIEPTVREAGDAGTPVVISHPDSAAAKVFAQVAATLAGKARGLAGRPLTLTPV